MGNFFSESQSEAERLRASKQTINAIVDQFRARPQSEWKTILAEVSLALESEWSDQQRPTNGVSAPTSIAVITTPATSQARESADPLRTSEIQEAARGSHADRAAALFRKTPAGFLPPQLGAALYGAADNRGTHKARAVVNFLQRKRKMPIKRSADGRWVLMPSEGLLLGTVAR